MTVLYSNNFNAETEGGNVANWVSTSSDFRCYPGGGAVSGLGYGRTSNGEIAYWNSSLGAQAVRIAQLLQTGHNMGVVVCWQGSDNCYYMQYDWNGTNLQAQIFKRDGGLAGSVAGSYNIPASAGDLIHLEGRYTGSSNLECRVWTGSNARPSAASITMTDSRYAGGYAGLRKSGAFAWTMADNLVITDAAGGEDFFYPPPPTPTLTGSVTLDNMAPTGSMLTQPLSSMNGAVTLDEMLASGSLGLQPGAINSEPFKNWSGTLQAGVTIPKVAVVRISDMATVLNLTNQTTNGSGVLSITSSAMVPGVRYLLVTCDATGTAFGAEPYTAV